MLLDKFIDQYVKQVSQEISTCMNILAEKDFAKKSDFSKVQGKLHGLQLALSLLRAMPEDE